MKLRGVLLLIIIPLLAACAEYKVDAPAEVANYSTLRPSAASYADMKFDALALPTNMDFSIGRSDGSFDFSEGVSYYRAFELPKTGSAYKVTVRSYQVADRCYPCQGFVYFYQKLKFLDAAKKPIDDIAQSAPDYRMGFKIGSRVIDATVPANSNARYLVVYTTRESIEKGDTHTVTGLSTMIMISPGVFVPISTPDQDKNFGGSPIGELSIAVEAGS